MASTISSYGLARPVAARAAKVAVDFHIRIFGEYRRHGSQYDGRTSERLCLESDALQEFAKFFEPQHGRRGQLHRGWKQEMLTRHHLGAKPRFEHFVQNTFLEGVLIKQTVHLGPSATMNEW